MRKIKDREASNLPKVKTNTLVKVTLSSHELNIIKVDFLFIAEPGGIVVDWIAFCMVTQGPRPFLAYDSAYLQVLSVLTNQPAGEKENKTAGGGFHGPGTDMYITGQNSVMWPHLYAREAKKCSCLPRGKGNEFWQIHALFCHC